MNAREDIVAGLRQVDDGTVGDLTPEELLDAHRAEVLTEAAGILRDRAKQYPTRRVFAAGLRHGALALAKAAMGRGKSSPSGADATPDFFEPGRTYRSHHDGYTAPELILTFLVEHVTRHPDRGRLRAIGWMRTGEPGAGWHGDFRDEHEFRGWTDITTPAGEDDTP